MGANRTGNTLGRLRNSQVARGIAALGITTAVTGGALKFVHESDPLTTYEQRYTEVDKCLRGGAFDTAYNADYKERIVGGVAVLTIFAADRQPDGVDLLNFAYTHDLPPILSPADHVTAGYLIMHCNEPASN